MFALAFARRRYDILSEEVALEKQIGGFACYIFVTMSLSWLI